MEIRIKGLRLRAVVGVNESERRRPQDIIVNVEFEFDGRGAADSDDIAQAVDYDALSRRIAELVESSRFFLLEKLSGEILNLVMSDKRVRRASVEVDKPAAIPSADSVSVVASAER